MQPSAPILPSAALKPIISMNPFRRITPLEHAVRQLEHAQLQRLEASSHREFYTHMARMYDERISRLRIEIATLTKEQEDV